MATGTIQQVMNNSDTGYCKMPDGTLICWGRQSMTAEPGARASAQISFPVTFIEAPSVSAMVDALIITPTGERVIDCAVTTGLSTVTLYMSNKTSASSTNYVSYIAIGRWK